MSLSAGTQMGPYVVRDLIGVGGMGEVYRARDTKLDRDVALKVLPSTLSTDPERVARFRREAQILASLNHPHIAAIYGFHEQAAAQVGEPPMQALVLELVDGPTLAERIIRGPLPLEEALAVARQIAAALDAAHEHGIVHRDLKPANVKVRTDGTVKVLDFGLAKALDAPAAPVSGMLTSPAMTRLGVVLGTAAYMAPEQVRGLPADKRSDIWAFGCVLYEMLTGSRAFAGEDSSEAMATVLRGEPDWTALPDSVPPPVRALLRRCLAKDPARRLRDIGDARLDLEEAHGAADVMQRPARVSARARLGWTLAGLTTGLAAAFAVTLLRTSDPPPETHVELTTPGTLDSLSVALSPDGRAVAFGAADDSAWQLWMRRLDDGTPAPLLGTAFGQYPFWSPDGRSIAFFAAGELARVDVEGGPRRILARAVPGGGGDWGPNGDILFAPSLGSSIYHMSASGGPATPVTAVGEGQYGHRFPQFLPDGRRFLFYVRGSEPTRGIYIASLDEPQQLRRLTVADAAGLYVAPGWLLFPQQGVLLARRFDAARGELSGDPIVIAEGLSTNEASARAFSAVANGSLAYATYQTPSRLTWFDRSGRLLGLIGAAEDYDLLDPEVSPDGVRVAATRTRQNNTDVWVFDAARGMRFTLEASAERYPTWSPDGRELLFQSDRNGPADLYIGPANAPGRERPALVSSDRKYPSDWSPDGVWMLYFGIDPAEPMGASPDLWLSSLGTDPQTRAWLKTPVTELWGQFSPDGKYIAYHSIEAGQSHDIYVRRFSAPEERWTISTTGGVYPRWSRDGRELYYIAPDRTLMAVPIDTGGSELVVGVPQPLFRPRIVGGGRNVVGMRHQYDVAPDGRFLVNVESDDGPSSSISLLLNWRPQ